MNKLLNGSGQVCGFLKADFRGFLSKTTLFSEKKFSTNAQKSLFASKVFR